LLSFIARLLLICYFEEAAVKMTAKKGLLHFAVVSEIQIRGKHGHFVCQVSKAEAGQERTYQPVPCVLQGHGSGA
jgi:hypothetical protein